ncbi:hypothetical protein KO491_08845 [Roseovarius nubinhibens]|uniref:Uncharacterized protein n=1 Tax=Roseovarius nubinhibens TaxID=314263 RepID=A0A348WHS1_9RHOB|nr:hypothetical protein [Roseovarius nubinhibens]MBU2999945.1 hypothetical protein [Roseovarius nubinhibens]HAR54083.1 hypothetical protein [Roseovarius nubinhibens]|tara:strand:- start:3248 stop:3619 length:372 start_codon:yes stop_codon:yes gene_type:complete
MQFNPQPWVIWVLSLFVFSAVGQRAFDAVVSLSGDKTEFLALPLTVLIPALAFLFLATRKDMSSAEGVLMQIGTMIQLLLIIALPGFALYLALGFPVVFLVIELFETRAPTIFRSWIKVRVIA